MIENKFSILEKDGTFSNKKEKEIQRIFVMFLLSCILMNFDTGVIPISIISIKKETNFGYTQIAFLGSLSYLGITFSSLFVPYFVKKYSTIQVLALSMLLNVVSCVFFALSYNQLYIYLSRFLMGISQSFWCVYGPVWVNNFSPSNKQALWLGMLAGFSPLGIMLGYIFTAFVINIFKSYLWAWRISILFQGLFEVIILVMVLFADPSNIDFNYEDKKQKKQQKMNFIQSSEELNQQQQEQQQQLEEEEEEVQEHEEGFMITLVKQIYVVISNRMYFLCLCCYSCIIFVAFCIQFWCTTYMIQILNQEEYMAYIVYTFIMLTSPTVGVVVGGYLSDKLGGYKGQYMLNAIKLCFVFNLACSLLSIVVGFSFDIITFTLLIWITVFIGALEMPTLTGIMLYSLQKIYQPCGQSFNSVFNNFFGFFLSPIFGGFIMDRFQNKQMGMVWGFRLSTLIIVLGQIFISLAWIQFQKFKKLNKFLFLKKDYQNN